MNQVGQGTDTALLALDWPTLFLVHTEVQSRESGQIDGPRLSYSLS